MDARWLNPPPPPPVIKPKIISLVSKSTGLESKSSLADNNDLNIPTIKPKQMLISKTNNNNISKSKTTNISKSKTNNISKSKKEKSKTTNISKSKTNNKDKDNNQIKIDKDNIDFIKKIEFETPQTLKFEMTKSIPDLKKKSMRKG